MNEFGKMIPALLVFLEVKNGKDDCRIRKSWREIF